ncbi:MAG: CapA family protein [bacterium]|nr:CapA family protein [bacterium]
MRRLSWMPFVFALSLLVALVLRPVPAQAQRCTSTEGRVIDRTYSSELVDLELVYTVYLPPCYAQTDATYPVLYLMHGSNSTNRLWVDLGLPQAMDAGIEAGVLPPFVVVMPYGAWMANENRFDRLSWENVFLTELLPDVEANHRVSTDRATRAIGGISRGGFWAFHIAFRNPALFSTVGGHSAFFDPQNAPPDFNPLDLALNAPGIESLRIWLDRGRDDYAQYGFDLMHDNLTTRGLPHDYIVYPEGEHNNAYWSSHVAEYLAFYSVGWEAPSQETITTQAEATSEATASALPLSIRESGGEQVRQGGEGLSESVSLFLPATAFRSTQTRLDLDRLNRILNGEVDPALVLDSATAEALIEHGVPVDPFNRVLPPDQLQAFLWENPDRYTLLAFDALTPRYRVLRIQTSEGDLHPLDMPTYPFAFESESPNFDPALLTRMTFSGVTALARNTLTALDNNGVEWAAEGILPYVSTADFFHVSNEVSFAPRCPEADEPVLGGLCSKDAHFDLLTLLGVDILELTGNHNNDYGFNVYRRSLEMYREAGMQTVGGGESVTEARAPLIVEHNGTRVGLFACNWNGPEFALASDFLGEERPGAAYCVIDGWLREAIPALRQQVDVVVVLVQYAEYDRYNPIERQLTHFRTLGEIGADVVLGTQAHRPQVFEFHASVDGRESFLHHGLGNLYFDQPELENREFFMDTLYLYDGRLLTVDLFTGVIEDFARPRPMTAEEQATFLEKMLFEHGSLLAGEDTP